MHINPLSVGRVSDYLERLKQGGDGQSHALGQKKGDGVGSRFAALLDDPLVALGQGGAVQDFLGIGTGKAATEMSPMENAVFGGMNLTNVKALATLTQVMNTEASPFASMFRNIATPEGNAVRMSVNKATAAQSYQRMHALMESSSAAAKGDMEGALRALVTAAGTGQQSSMNPSETDSALQGKVSSGTQAYAAGAHPAGTVEAAPAGTTTGVAGNVIPKDAAGTVGPLGGRTGSTTATQGTALEQEAQVAFAEARAHVQTNGSYQPGALSALFESGKDGIAAIGYDRRGGTSYGKYQLSSRAGTMDAFIEYLENNAPDIGANLREAGRANTGSRRGAMPTAWQTAAAAQPERFEALQDSFIHSNNFYPAFRAISKAMNLNTMAPALQEVLFSTAVHHGPTGAVRIFARAYGSNGGFQSGQEADFIRNIYQIRQGQFGSSTQQIRTAVQGRLGDELRMALSMLEQGQNSLA